MQPFATDLDLLHWEPTLFKDAAFVSQTLIEATATLAGSVVTLAAGSFIDAAIAPAHVAYFGGGIDGSFPVVAVDSATQLSISVLYDQLVVAGGDATPTQTKDASDINLIIRTFWPQRQVVSELLLNTLGLSSTQANQILNPQSLKRACVLGTLQMVYSALAAAGGSAAHIVRSDLYEKLYRRSLRSARVELDLNGDGEGDCMRVLNTLTLSRA